MEELPVLGPEPTVLHVIEREKVYIVICPFCGTKNEMGLGVCKGCGGKL